MIEDYQKQYKVFEIGLKKEIENSNKVFPLEHKLDVINIDNYFEKLKELL